MTASARPSLTTALTVICEDAFFAVTAARKLDTDLLRALAKRRAPVVTGLGPDVSGGLMQAWEPWLTSLCAAIAPLSPPKWMPMSDAVENGLSLEHGARGVRSLFTSKPSEKEILRIRTIGSLAVRVLTAVMAATGTFTGEHALLRAAAVASLGLPEEDQRMLTTETPILADVLEVYGDVDPKLARAIIRGAFQAGMGDGLDPREEEAVLRLATKLGLATEAVNEARNLAKQAIDQGKSLGDATVDAIRYVLSDAAPEVEKFGIAAARLILPTVHRREALTAINVGGTVTLAKKHTVDRKEREAALGLTWISVLASDPSCSRRVELSLRHDRIAQDLGDRDLGPSTREVVERHITSELSQVVSLREGTTPSK